MKCLDELTNRLRFGVKPGLDAMRAACAAVGNPERKLRGVIHVAGTNGKGAVCAVIDACLRAAACRVGRYTSPHLVRINERFFIDGSAVSDRQLDQTAASLRPFVSDIGSLTYFEYLTLMAFVLYAETDVDFTVLETGLGGMFDATNVCHPALTVITRIGLDHCEWLGDTVEKVASQKAGIVKPGVPVVLGENAASVRAVVERRAREVHAPFHYAPDVTEDSQIPSDFSLAGKFNRENARTALAALKVLADTPHFPDGGLESCLRGFAQTVWPARFQRIGSHIVDGAHNPPAARALADALSAEGFGPKSLHLICGFCGDKDVDDILTILEPFVSRAFAVRTNNPRSLSASETAARLAAVRIPAIACDSLRDALARSSQPEAADRSLPATLIAGSLFLAGEALVALGAPPWGAPIRFDAAEKMKRT